MNLFLFLKKSEHTKEKTREEKNIMNVRIFEWTSSKKYIKRAADISLEGALLGCSVAGCAAGVWQVAMP